MVIIGTVKSIEPKIEGENAQGKDWSRQQVVLDQGGETYSITAFGERKIALISKLQPGTVVQASVEVKSMQIGANRYTDLKLNTLRVLRGQAPEIKY